MVRQYLHLHDKKLQTKIADLYYGKFIRYVRYSVHDGKIYICSCVSAEMFKNCVYNVDICLDAHGIVQEAQCECKAGSGPQAHCKHVTVTLLALTHAKTGIITKETCTQQLQTFHQAKPYSGSPVKMQKLNMRRDGKLAALPNFDPRPREFRHTESYSHDFRNVWLNCPVPHLSIRQLYSPANLRAINVDHDYLEKIPSDIFLDSHNITSITDSEISTIEVETRGQSTNKKWKFERTKRIHASNFGRVCKATDKTDFSNLAKTLTQSTEIKTAAIEHGKRYEKIALEGYSMKTNNTVTQCGIFVSHETPFLAASPDGLVDELGIVEVKCPYTAKDEYITVASVPYLYEDTQGIYCLQKSHQYYYQVQGTMLCANRQWCDFVVWTFNGIKVIRICRDSEFISEMVNKLRWFFDTHFKDAILQKFYYRC